MLEHVMYNVTCLYISEALLTWHIVCFVGCKGAAGGCFGASLMHTNPIHGGHLASS